MGTTGAAYVSRTGQTSKPRVAMQRRRWSKTEGAERACRRYLSVNLASHDPRTHDAPSKQLSAGVEKAYEARLEVIQEFDGSDADECFHKTRSHRRTKAKAHLAGQFTCTLCDLSRDLLAIRTIE